MLTLFTCPRAFEGHTGIIQTNALCSWRALGFGVSRPLVVLSDGTEPTPPDGPALRYVPVACDAHGTPLVSSVFERGAAVATTPLVGYVNSDIILLDDFMPAVERAAAAFPGPFLMIGQRIDLNVPLPLTFRLGWQTRLRKEAARRGTLHQSAGIDYLVYRPGTLGELPPFALARWRWDNWIVWHVLEQGHPVIDATRVITAIHQNHDHSHHGEAGIQQTALNDRLVHVTGGRLCRISDATHIMTQDSIKIREKQISPQ